MKGLLDVKWASLFPTKWALFIFVAYMALFINQGILVTASQSKNHKGYSYNTVTAVLLTEVIKLVVSSGIFMQRNSVNTFVSEVQLNKKLFMLYFIPAGLYCLYNNLAYTNLLTFDPTTYFLLLQLRVVVTGIVFQVLFSKKLSKHQWLSLIFLTLGCMIKELNFDALFTNSNYKPKPVAFNNGSVSVNHKESSSMLQNPLGIVLILLQVLFSSSAGVYNEYLLKRPVAERHTPVLIQNVCLYIDSIVCNVFLLTWNGTLSSGLNYESLKQILSTPIILAVVCNNAAIGIVTSFFLSQLNSILKTFASALELMFTAVLCWLIFDIPIHANTMFAIMIVTFSILLYSKEPVQNPAKMTSSKSEEKEMQKILDEEIQV